MTHPARTPPFVGEQPRTSSPAPAPVPVVVTTALAGTALAGAILLGVAVAGQRVPTALDRAFTGLVDAHLDGSGTGSAALLRVLVLPTEPAAVLAALGVVVLTCLVRGHRVAAVFAVAAPALAVTLNTWLLKPLFGRYYADHLAYPSGHTVSLVCVLTVLGVLAATPWVRWLVAVVGVPLVGCAAVGMAGLGYHYLTDVVGGVAFGVAVTLGCAPALHVRRRERTSRDTSGVSRTRPGTWRHRAPGP